MSDKALLREFAARDWQIAERDGAAVWAERHRRLGGAETLRAAHLLWRQMKVVRPDWPDAAIQAADLEHLIQFTALIDRTNRGAVNL